MESESQFQEQGFFEYHLYTLQRPTTIGDNETKQVSLLEAAGFDVKKEFVLNGQRYYYTSYNNPGQPIKEKVGDAFDIVAERKQTDYKVIARNVYEYAYEIKIRNHKDGPVTIVVNEPIGGDWEMISSTFEAKKTAAFAAQFNVPVAKDGEATLSYRVRVRY